MSDQQQDLSRWVELNEDGSLAHPALLEAGLIVACDHKSPAIHAQTRHPAFVLDHDPRGCSRYTIVSGRTDEETQAIIVGRALVLLARVGMCPALEYHAEENEWYLYLNGISEGWLEEPFDLFVAALNAAMREGAV